MPSALALIGAGSLGIGFLVFSAEAQLVVSWHIGCVQACIKGLGLAIDPCRHYASILHHRQILIFTYYLSVPVVRCCWKSDAGNVSRQEQGFTVADPQGLVVIINLAPRRPMRDNKKEKKNSSNTGSPRGGTKRVGVGGWARLHGSPPECSASGISAAQLLWECCQGEFCFWQRLYIFW